MNAPQLIANQKIRPLHTAAERLCAPEFCPITGRQYWGHVDHPERGSIPTYGGPLDTFAIPRRTGEIGADDEWSVDRYDQDRGEWLTEGFL